MATMYEIDQQILDCIDGETGEIVDVEKLQSLQLERETKIENIALWYKNLISDAEAYKKEKDSFAAKEKAAKDKAESLKNYLNYLLQGQKFKTVLVDIGFRKSQVVDIAETEVGHLPEEFQKVKIEPDKTAIKNAIKKGQSIPGCRLLDKQNIQIK